jgi:hypothetical protein
MVEKWKAALEWYKQLMTVDGAAGVAIAAFLTFAGRGTNVVGVPTVIVAYLSNFCLLDLCRIGSSRYVPPYQLRRP